MVSDDGDGVHGDVFVFHGETFTMPDRTGSMALMRFAHIAEQDQLTDLQEAAAIFDLLEATVNPADWDRFQRHAMKTRATTEELVLIAAQVIREVSLRPTSRPSDSSDGPPVAAQSSTSPHAERAIGRLAGRPDLQNVVDMSERARAS